MLMETYRLNSRLLDRGSEFVIQTANDPNSGTVRSTVHVNGSLSESWSYPHPTEINPEEVMSLVKVKHLEKKQELEALISAARKVIAERNVDSMCQLGTAFHYKSLHAQAKELFMGAITADSECHQAYHYLGQTELAAGDVKAAIDAGIIAVRKRPGYADYHNSLGEAYLAAGSYKQATDEFEEAIRINLYYSDAYFNLGLAILANAVDQKDPALFANVVSRSMDSFQKAALIYPEYKNKAFDDGIRALKSTAVREALQQMKLVREEKRERRRQEFAPFHMRFVLAPEWISDEALGERIEYLQAQLERNPTYVDLHAELARCYLEQAKIYWGKGVQQLKRTLEVNPSLSKTRIAEEAAEREYQTMSSVLARITEKG